MTTPPQPPHATFAPKPPNAPAAKSPWYGKRRVLLPATAVVFLAIGASGGSKPADTTTTARPAATVTVTSQGTAAPAPAVTVTETAQAPAPAQPAGDRIGGDGTYEVNGTEMKPGKWKTAGPASNIIENCYYERNKGGDGLGSIIANDNTKGPATVNVKQGEFFKTSGCQDWVKVG